MNAQLILPIVSIVLAMASIVITVLRWLHWKRYKELVRAEESRNRRLDEIIKEMALFDDQRSKSMAKWDKAVADAKEKASK